MSQYARRFQTPVLVETGTYLGDMVEAQRHSFERIYSIELDKELALRAQKRFASEPHITILQGDSGELLASLIPGIDAPCLFWLDGHYSEGFTARGALQTPIRQELRTILGAQRPSDAVLIDDARLFTGRDDYPALDELVRSMHHDHPQWAAEVRDDIIRMHVARGPLA